ncbi:MAG: helix-turn-helix transcriptional regulator, partial [Clostridia bacterium]|nr:helix-turn-helix transcriptional regulator [Clostridia bacterium]
FLYNYTISAGYTDAIGSISENLALFGTIFMCCVITLVIYLTLKYTLYLLPLDDKQSRLGNLLTGGACIIILLVVLVAIIFVTGGDWVIEAGRNLNALFSFGSLLMIAPAILALVYHRKTEVKGNRQLLKGVFFSFLPVVLYFPLDMLFLRGSVFKATHIAYAVFAVSVYMYLTKHYTVNYEPETTDVMSHTEKFYKKYNISEREVEIIEALVVGKTNKEIAAELFISINTVKTHIKNIYRKLEVKNRVQLLHKIKFSNGDTPMG